MELSHLMTLDVEVSRPTSIGETPKGEVRLIPITGGRFDGGPELSGVVLPGGADWQSVRSDDTLEIRAHYLLETERGETIEVESSGIRAGSPEVLARLAAGDPVAADEYYFRTHVRMYTAAERLHHLNDRLAIAVGERRSGRVHLTVLLVP